MCSHTPQRTGVDTAEGKTRPQTHGVHSIHLRRHFSSKSLPSTIQRPQARIDYQKLILDPWNESNVNGKDIPIRVTTDSAGAGPKTELLKPGWAGAGTSRTEWEPIRPICSTDLDQRRTSEAWSWTGCLRVGLRGCSTRGAPEPNRTQDWAIKSDWAGAGAEPSVSSTSRTEREPIRPMLAGPGSEPDPWGQEPDRTTPTRTEREPDTLRTGAYGAGPMAGPEPDVPRPYLCDSDLLGLPSGRRQPARTMDLVLLVPPNGPGLTSMDSSS